MVDAARRRGPAVGGYPLPRVAAGLLLLLAFVVPLYVPPESRPLVLVTPDTPLVERIFPGVPAAWVLVRLACLVAGIALLAFGPVRSRMVVDPGAVPDDPSDRASLRGLTFAGGCVCVASLASPFFSHGGQLLLVLVLFLVPFVAGAFGLRGRLAAMPGAIRPCLIHAMPAVVAIVWLLQRLPSAYGSHLLTDAIDYLSAYQCYIVAAADGFLPLTDGCWTGYTAGPLVFHGVGVLGWKGMPLSMAAVQTVAACWSALCGALLGMLVLRTAGPACGLLTTSVFLWSPIVLLRPLIPGAPAQTTFAVLLVLLAFRLRRSVTAPAAAAFGAVLGFSALQPNLVLVAPLFAAAMARAFLGRPRHALVAALFFLASFLPGAARLPEMFATARSQAQATGQWAILDAFYRGKVSPSLAEAAGTSSDRDAFGDVAVGLALAPVAVARAPTRLWGDVMIEPVGAAMATVGLFAALARGGTTMWRFVVAFLVAALLPGLASSYDRVMPSRVEMVVPLSLLAAHGWTVVVGGLGAAASSLAAGLVLVLTVAASGTWIFDHVQPRILAPSVAGLAARAQTSLGEDMWWSQGIVFGLADAEVLLGEILGEGTRTRRLDLWDVHAGDLAAVAANKSGFFWTPGEQMEVQVSHAVCRSLPNHRLFEVVGATGDTRLFAALRVEAPSPGAGVRWIARDCSELLETDATAATRVLRQARELVMQDRADEAIASLREAANLRLVQPRLYMPLAELLVRRGREGDREEATRWSGLACHLTEGSDLRACLFLQELRRREATPPPPGS